MKLLRAVYRSPIGRIEIRRGARGVTSLVFAEPEEGETGPVPDALRPVVRQLDEYFHGQRRRITVAVAPDGTPFQRRVWAALRKIPYGGTASYGEIAKALGKPGAARAVGLANNRNPVSIIIPCHRVIGHDGGLVGYGGGLWRKEWLLAHEKSLSGTESGRRPRRPRRPTAGGR